MSIFNHFKHLNLSQDQEIALSKLEDFLANPAQVFLLKGYAGTGKTTLLQGVVIYLKEQKKNVQLMAPTGRAAKILRDKTGMGSTIHKGIYNFEKLVSLKSQAEDVAEQSFHYYFPLNNLTEETIIIVDESSMISYKEAKHELFTFGTGILLQDLLTYAKLSVTKNKIIFVGDPAQLPPIGDNKSWALDINLFKGKELVVTEYEMTSVKRQSNNLILVNATLLRQAINDENPIQLKLQIDNQSFIKIDPVDVLLKYTELFPVPNLGNGVIINFSNQQCYHQNNAIRKIVYPEQNDIVSGDVILINNNNYHTYGVEIFNGDFAQVVEVSPTTKKLSAPVMTDQNGKKVRVIIDLIFRKVVIRIPTHSEDIKCYILDSLLNSEERDLSIDEMKAIYINFVMRFQELQKLNKEQNKEYHNVGSEAFKMALKSDPFFNALKVKYGYAITCHKAQGGEWDTVFVDYQGRVSLKKEPLRWCYTATTRGVNKVYAINMPHFGILNKFIIETVGKIGTLPKEALNFNDVHISPWHIEGQHLCKSHKYWMVLENILPLNATIENIKSEDYLEKYSVRLNDELINIHGIHKGTGHFHNGFNIINPKGSKNEQMLLNAFNDTRNFNTSYNYSTNIEPLNLLHNQILSICDEIDIIITNIKLETNYVNYYFITDSICSYIQFYFNGQYQLTTAMPKTYNSDNDIKLQTLTTKLLNYAKQGN